VRGGYHWQIRTEGNENDIGLAVRENDRAEVKYIQIVFLLITICRNKHSPIALIQVDHVNKADNYLLINH
jgi:hypothetical protein